MVGHREASRRSSPRDACSGGGAADRPVSPLHRPRPRPGMAGPFRVPTALRCLHSVGLAGARSRARGNGGRAIPVGRTTTTAVRVAAFFCLLLVVSVAVHFDSPYLMSDLVRWGATGLFLILAAPLSRLAILDKLGRRVWDFILRHGSAVVPLLALLVFAATSVICHAVLDPIPHISDEISYLFQARVFASGHLTLPAPSMPGFFPAEWISVHDDRWFSVFPPGWPRLLSRGARLGVPSLVNPFLAALTILSLPRLAVHLAGPTKALAVALLCAVSPFFLFMCASFMSHPASLLFATLCLLLLLKASDSGNAAWFALAGCCAGFGFLVRPLDAAVLWSVPAAFLLLRHRTRRQLLG